jgi:hypothetical protein
MRIGGQALARAAQDERGAELLPSTPFEVQEVGDDD